MHAETDSGTETCDFGLIGLAVMGENLALNVESRGFRVAVNNRTTSKVDALLEGRGKGKKFVGCHSVAELVGCLARPRKVMLMVKGGPGGRCVDRRIAPAAISRRCHSRWRQHVLSRHRASRKAGRGGRNAVCRRGCFGRGRRRAAGAELDARRQCECLAHRPRGAAGDRSACG